MEPQHPLVRLCDPLRTKHHLLQCTPELRQRIPQQRKILPWIGGTDTAHVDAARHAAVEHQGVIERQVAMRDHALERQRQMRLERRPDLLGRPSATRFIEIGDGDTTGGDVLPRVSLPSGEDDKCHEFVSSCDAAVTMLRQSTRGATGWRTDRTHADSFDARNCDQSRNGRRPRWKTMPACTCSDLRPRSLPTPTRTSPS